MPSLIRRPRNSRSRSFSCFSIARIRHAHLGALVGQIHLKLFGYFARGHQKPAFKPTVSGYGMVDFAQQLAITQAGIVAIALSFETKRSLGSTCWPSIPSKLKPRFGHCNWDIEQPSNQCSRQLFELARCQFLKKSFELKQTGTVRSHMCYRWNLLANLCTCAASQSGSSASVIARSRARLAIHRR